MYVRAKKAVRQDLSAVYLKCVAAYFKFMHFSLTGKTYFRAAEDKSDTIVLKLSTAKPFHRRWSLA